MWIKLHGVTKTEPIKIFPIYINSNHIIIVCETIEGTVITLRDNSSLRIKESPEEVVDKLGEKVEIE